VLGRWHEALRALEEIRINIGETAEIDAEMGRLFLKIRRPELAVMYYKSGLVCDPNYEPALDGLIRHGRLAYADPELALSIFERLRAKNGADDHFYWLVAGQSAWNLGQQASAESLYDEAKFKFANRPIFRLCGMLSVLRAIYESESELENARARYADRLAEFSDFLSAGIDRRKALSTLWQHFPPSRLPYQAKNDCELQQRYGRLLAVVMAERVGDLDRQPSRDTAEEPRRIRVGVISSFFYRHAGWRNRRGWFYHLETSRYKKYLYDIGEYSDDMTYFTYGCFEVVRSGAPKLEQWVHQIRNDALDILVFPELGMDGLTYALAATRLAPVQCMSFGHPETSGLPTIDYMLSSDLMEPPNAQEHYTETLVRLPGTGFYRYPVDWEIEPTSREEFGLNEDDVIFFYGHNPVKMLPRDDDLLPRIATQCSAARFIILVRDDAVGLRGVFEERMRVAFARYGLESAEHCCLLPKQNPRKFTGLIGISDIFLDCPSWNGNNVTVDALSAGLPPVPMAGEFLRSRHTLGIMRQMGLGDDVCADKQEMISYAARLGADPDLRKRVARQVRDRVSEIFSERACLDALDSFFQRVAGTSGSRERAREGSATAHWGDSRA
jgi:predicted O-linked N-acetylglucosamine transferase (SPINDLY family)